MKKILCLVLAAAMLLACLTACGSKTAEKVYAVESGSAGEAAATEAGLSYTAVLTQADALM